MLRNQLLRTLALVSVLGIALGASDLSARSGGTSCDPSACPGPCDACPIPCETTACPMPCEDACPLGEQGASVPADAALIF